MLAWVRANRTIAGIVAVVGVAVVALLAFGVFGVQTLFTDDVADESGPVFDSGLSDDAIDPAMQAEMDAAMETDGTDTMMTVDEPMPMPMPMDDVQEEADADTAMEIMSVATGEFVGRSHPGTGQALELTDGSEQRFLRFENFETDNGPDLNVYLVAGSSAEGDAGTFDDDFVDLGDLKGNVGPQNYEIPVDVDLDRYSTVVVWCVRFGVAFTAADLS